MTLPKPPRRARKPPKPIVRRVPLPRVHKAGKRSRVPEALARYRALEKQADKLWSFIVRSRGQLCERCRRRPAAHPHHLVSRRYRQTRWLTVNGANICAGCHMLVGQDGEENRALALRLIHESTWAGLNIGKSLGKVDPALMVVILREEIRRRDLEAQAREKGLI